MAGVDMVGARGVWARTIPYPQWIGEGVTQNPLQDRRKIGRGLRRRKQRESRKYRYDLCPFGTDLDDDFDFASASDWHDAMNWAGLVGDPVFLVADDVQSVSRSWRNSTIYERLEKQQQWRIQRKKLVDAYRKEWPWPVRVFLKLAQERARKWDVAALGALFFLRGIGLPLVRYFGGGNWPVPVQAIIGFAGLFAVCYGLLRLLALWPNKTWPRIETLRMQPTTTITYHNRTVLVVEGPPEGLAAGLGSIPQLVTYASPSVRAVKLAT